MRKVEDGAGLAGSGWELIVDEEKIAQRKKEHGDEACKLLSDKGEFNFISMETIKDIRKGDSPLAAAYLTSIGEAIDTRTDGGNGKGKNGKRGRDGKPNNRNLEDAAAAKAKADAEAAAAAAAAAAPQDGAIKMAVDSSTTVPGDSTNPAAQPGPSTSDTPLPPADAASTAAAPAETPMDVDSHPSRSFVPDLAPVRATEKRRLDWRGKLYLAPLTTVGNEPFRRLCGDYGNDISCSEMGLAQEFMNGELKLFLSPQSGRRADSRLVAQEIPTSGVSYEGIPARRSSVCSFAEVGLKLSSPPPSRSSSTAISTSWASSSFSTLPLLHPLTLAYPFD